MLKYQDTLEKNAYCHLISAQLNQSHQPIVKVDFNTGPSIKETIVDCASVRIVSIAANERAVRLIGDVVQADILFYRAFLPHLSYRVILLCNIKTAL